MLPATDVLNLLAHELARSGRRALPSIEGSFGSIDGGLPRHANRVCKSEAELARDAPRGSSPSLSRTLDP
jgi:hypothetical protein